MSASDVRLDPRTMALIQDRLAILSALGTLTGATLDESAHSALGRMADRLHNMYPYHDERYVGQLLKPPHPVAWAAYATTMLLNPNNHALDGGPATAEMEREAVAAIAAMLGVRTPLGHLTSSGTIANLEALWVSRELRPGEVILSASNAHYTHERMCTVIGADHETVGVDGRGAIDSDALAARLAAGGVGTVVATLGTTGMGVLDPVDELVTLCRRYGARLHVDAAYGGFFALLADGQDPGVERAPFAALADVDSLVIDPHKHGLQPYGCGCVLFADPGVGRLYAHDSPYTYFTSGELHLGEISLECSRPGSAAAALWATLEALPLTRDGLGTHLAGARSAALRVADAFADAAEVALAVAPDLDIVCPFAMRERTSQISIRSEAAFDSLARAGWHAAKLRVNSRWLARRHGGIEVDSDEVTTLRCCLIKQEHDEIAADLAAALIEHLSGD